MPSSKTSKPSISGDTFFSALPSLITLLPFIICRDTPSGLGIRIIMCGIPCMLLRFPLSLFEETYLRFAVFEKNIAQHFDASLSEFEIERFLGVRRIFVVREIFAFMLGVSTFC